MKQLTRRIADMSTLSPKGQALVRAVRRAYQPTDADRERLLGQLRSQLGDGVLPTDMGTATSAAAAGSSAWPLISVVVVCVGILGGAVLHVWPRAGGQHQVQQTPAVSLTATPQVTEPVAPPSDEQPTVSVAASATVDPPVVSAARPKDGLAAEVAILSRATRDLRAGRPADALKSLDEYRRRFPRGLLSVEQQAARAQVLCAMGRFDEAKAKLGELPQRSPLALRAKQFCDARAPRTGETREY
jgi:hypothetical protein